jgi:uroporphyrinogen-III decarboxylase
VDSVDVDAVGLDWMTDRGFGHDAIQRRWAVRGNLDPLALPLAGAALDLPFSGR